MFLDAMVPPGEFTRLTFTVPNDAWYGRFDVECSGVSYFAFRQSNVVGDLGEAACPLWDGWDVGLLFHGTEYSVEMYATEPTRIVVSGEYAYDKYNDHRDFHPFHWFTMYGSGIGTWPILVGNFTPPFDITDVQLSAEGALVEVYQTSPEPQLVWPNAGLGNAFPDLAGGATYAVRMSAVGTCQPACLAQSEVGIRGVPSEAS